MRDSRAFGTALDATWPAANRLRIGHLTYRDGAGGGKRVSAATLDGPFDPAELSRVETRFATDRRDMLFMIRDGQEAFDAVLAARSYAIIDPVISLACDLRSNMALCAPDPEYGYVSWPPTAIQRNIWAEGGVGAARLAVMDRAKGPKCTILGRLGDRPSGTCFVGIHDNIAAVHALEIRRDARRNGLGRAMMLLAADWARAQGARHLALQVTRANTGALRLYSSLGMSEVGQYHYRTKPITEIA